MKQETVSIKDLPKLQAKAAREKWERLLAQQIADAGIPEGIPNALNEKKFYIYMPGATHPCQPDRAWPGADRMLLLEVQGGQWSRGRHVRGSGFEADCRKYSWYALLGFRVMFVTPDMIEDGTAISLLRKEFEEVEF